MLGRLTEEALKHDWIEYLAGASMGLGGLFMVGLITYLGKWKWLWKEWLTSLDHKKIGIMYIVVSFVMLTKGLIDALMMRAQQAFCCRRLFWLFSCASLPTDLYSPWSYHDSFCWNGTDVWSCQPSRSPYDRSEGCRVSLFKLLELLAFYSWRHVYFSLSGYWRFCWNWLVSLSSSCRPEV